MTWILRPYQREAIDATYAYWEEEGGNPLVVLPTGTGKSGVAGTITRELCDNYRDMRIVNVTHVAELVEQNYKELVGMWEWAPAGVYSAGLNRRELGAQILFAGIQSVHKRVETLGAVDLLMVDEAHLIPRSAETMYGRFIAGLREANPDMRLLGLTATPYRTDSGRLDEGWTGRDGAEIPPMFDKVAYEYGIRTAIDDGYLKPLVSKATASAIDTSGVARRGGEFVAGALQAAADTDDLNRAIVEEALAYGSGRRSWLVFATGKEHAAHLRDELRRRGVSAECITDDTTTADRRRFIAAFKSYQLRALVNCGVLTTGFNHPGVDMIVAARPTESAGLYVQIAGRGTRPVYAHGAPIETREQRLAAIAAGPCPNCLFLDFGGLVRRHGPIDMVQPRKPGKGGGDAPVKNCPQCFSIIHASVMMCPDCGFEFERQLSDKITRTAAVGPILSKGEAAWKAVQQRRFYRHEKFGSPPSMRVEYSCGGGGNLSAATATFKEWIAFESEKAKRKAASWWRQHGGLEPVPATTTEALNRARELSPVTEIRIEPDGKFWRITGRRHGDAALGNNDLVDATSHQPSWAQAASDRAWKAKFAEPDPKKLATIRAWQRPTTGYAFDADLDDDVPF
jgi:DNA repair protein RadD